MYLLFEEAGKFMAGKVLSEAESSAQVELDSGKRVKVKAANALLKFEKPAPAAFVTAAQALSQTIELDLAWNFHRMTSLALPTWRAIIFQVMPSPPRWSSRPLPCSGCSNHPTIFAARAKGAFAARLPM